ncbi:MAG TPA: FAD-dependent oxidoreductase [Longimicrobiales bacterium]|nr:FAD-dependent oxidoreductase [Longimicrobiales bacterium]
MQSERVETVIIGGGQTGLSVGYHMARRGLPFVILEANPRIGDSWRNRWDSLRLFTPARYDGLAGMPFPARDYSFPTKDEMADYLEAYAAFFELPVRTRARVHRLARQNDHFIVSTGDREYEASQVVVAMASYQTGFVPKFASQLDPSILQMHSSEYRNPAQLRSGDVLLVGAANSGAEIALDLAPTHRVWLSGRHPGHVPFEIESFAARLLVPVLFRIVFHRLLTVDTPMGKKARPKLVSKGLPLVRTKPRHLDAAGVQQVPRVAGVRAGRPLLDDGRILEVANVIWCTGFHPGFDWIELPIFNDHGEPKQYRGVVDQVPGLYFTGLHFLYSASSTMIHGASRDADYIAANIAARTRASRSQSAPTTQ